MNEKKCNGYESMFTFLNEEDFKKHLEVCEDCRNEHARMQKVSELIQEAKPFIKEQNRHKRILKTACAVLAVVCTTLSYPIFTVGYGAYQNTKMIEEQQMITADEMGLPVDEYGFLYIN